MQIMQIIQIIQNPELFRISWLFDIRSVMNSECRIELLILYLFCSTETGGAEIRFPGISTGCFNVRKESHKL